MEVGGMSVMSKLWGFLGLQDEEELIERVRVEDTDAETEYNFADQRKNKGNVVGLPSTKPTKMVLSEPRSYEDTQEIADQLRQRRPVLVNLQRVRPDQGTRIVDFLSGTVYALNGGISKVGQNIFLCTPESIEVQGAITEFMDGDMDYKKPR
jgi:cell division inhibitor SepF